MQFLKGLRISCSFFCAMNTHEQLLNDKEKTDKIVTFDSLSLMPLFLFRPFLCWVFHFSFYKLLCLVSLHFSKSFLVRHNSSQNEYSIISHSNFTSQFACHMSSLFQWPLHISGKSAALCKKGPWICEQFANIISISFTEMCSSSFITKQIQCFYFRYFFSIVHCIMKHKMGM